MAVKMVTVREDDGFDLPRLGIEDGTAFGYFDRWNMIGMDPKGKYITDTADWEARDMHEMLTKDYKAKQIENVLTLPLTSAEYSIVAAEGDTGEAKWLTSYWETDAFAGGCRTSLHQIIGLMTSAFYYKRAYFEKVWRMGTGKFKGKFVYDDVAWRPQTTCRIMRDPKNGRFKGFEQEAYFVGPRIMSKDKWPIQIKPNRAFVYTHGTRRDPLNGTSDMEVAFWAWKTKQKVLLLWFQFLQSVSLPRITVKAGTTDEARQIANEIARMKASGVLPLGVTGAPDSVAIDALDVSGKGAEQFKMAIDWLDNAATQSVLAGFLDLVNHATTAGAGSYALSKDASDFFLQSLEAKAREMEDQIRRQLFAPLIRHNFGNDASVPRLKFEPLNDIDKETAVDLLKQAMAAPPGGPVPTDFIAELAGQVATYLGLEGDQAKESFKKSFDAAAAQAQAKMLADAGAAGGTPAAQGVAGLAGAVGAAHKAIQAGVAPGKAHADARAAVGADAKATAMHTKQQAARTALLEKHTKKAIAAKTGGEASLSNIDLAKLSKAERDALPASAFVFPSDRRYPIHDKNHAHAALIDSRGTKDEAAVRAAVRARYGWDASNSMEHTVDLAGFNPSEPRSAGGTWTTGSGGQSGKGKPKMSVKEFDRLEKEKAALLDQARVLRATLARLRAANHVGTHKGQAGKHSGPKGTKGSKSTGATKSTAKASTSKATAGHKPLSLPQQVARLEKEVEQLKREVVTAQQHAAKRR